jgi:hypothetical protein
MINRRAVLYATFALVLREAAASLNETLACGTRALDLRGTTLMSEDEIRREARAHAAARGLQRDIEGMKVSNGPAEWQYGRLCWAAAGE